MNTSHSIRRAAIVGAVFAILPAASALAVPVINGYTSFPRITNGIPGSTLTLTNPNTNPGTVIIDDRNFGSAASGTNRHDVRASINGGSSAATFSLQQSFSMSANVTLTDGANAPRKEAGFRIIGNPTGETLFIVNSDAGEIVTFGGGTPFKLFGKNSDGNGYTPGQTIQMGMNYVRGSAPGVKGTIEFFIDRDINSAAGFETTGALPYDNIEGGPVNYQLAAYGQFGTTATASATDFGRAVFGNLSVTVTPEPTTLASLALGGLMLRRRR